MSDQRLRSNGNVFMVKNKFGKFANSTKGFKKFPTQEQRSILDYFGVDSRNSAKSSSTSRKYLKSSSHDDQLTVFPVDIKDYIVNLILSSKKYDILDKMKNLQDLVYKSFGPQQFNIQLLKALSTAYIDIKFTEERDHETDNSAEISTEDERFGIRDVEIIRGTTLFLHYRGESDADSLKSTVYEG
ncbi:hypothetical protein LIER_29651 [Lithospermum erythrorhizon]|uniref:Uncharacterized protein n=1 Tax=Lithospermum erythrorhizon TaxID=34254 RepID=A0AAV3RKB6_LITER